MRLHRGFSLIVLVSLWAMYSSVPADAASPAWSFETVDTSGSTGWGASLAFDPTDGYPSIAFLELSRNKIKFSDWDGSAWTTDTVATGGSWMLKYDPAGRPCIGMAYGAKRDVRYACKDGGGWNIDLVDKTGGTFGTSLAYDAAGNPAIAYAVSGRKSDDVKLARWTGTTWTSSVVETETSMCNYVSLAFDAAGSPSIAYTIHATGGTQCGTLVFARWDGTAWIREVVDTAVAGGSVGIYDSLAYDPITGEAAISYSASDGTTGPRLARRTASGWSVEMVATAEYSYETSLVFDPSGRAYVFYIDGSSTSSYFGLNLAWNDGAAWNLEVIDRTSSGLDSSTTCFALTSGGVPAFAYRDSHANELRYAKRMGAP